MAKRNRLTLKLNEATRKKLLACIEDVFEEYAEYKSFNNRYDRIIHHLNDFRDEVQNTKEPHRDLDNWNYFSKKLQMITNKFKLHPDNNGVDVTFTPNQSR